MCKNEMNESSSLREGRFTLHVKQDHVLQGQTVIT